MRLIVEAAARTDIGDAAAWYNERQTGLGIVFLDAVNAALHRVSIKPRLFSLRRPDVRGASLKKFPYTIYFRQRRDFIQVVAVLHQNRDLSALDVRLN